MPGKTKSSLRQVALRIALEGEAATRDPVFIAGNLPALGGWNPRGNRLKKGPDGRLAFEFAVPAGKIVELKITRGSWKRQGIYGPPFEGFPPSNITFRVEEDCCLDLAVIQWFDQIPVKGDPVQGELRGHRFPPTQGLRHSRRVFVWLPPSYGQGHKRYPVLYMHDGQNLFDPLLSFSDHDWKADEVSLRLMRSGAVREYLIVGIANTPDRMEEYNFFRPLGKSYASWLQTTLMPFVDRRYRTLPGPENTAVMGSSMGGLISFQLGFHFPETFGMAGCLSPAFWQSRSQIYRQVRETVRLPRQVRFYLDGGEMEPEFVEAFQNMSALLREKGWQEGKNLLGIEAPGATHSELAWSERLHIPLQFFFGKKNRATKSSRQGAKERPGIKMGRRF